MYIRPLTLECPSHLQLFPHPSRLLQNPGLISLGHTANFHWLSNLHMVAYVFGEGSGIPLQDSCLGNPMDGGASKATVHGVAESDTTERLHFHFSLSCIGEGNGNSLQCSCLENPRDGGAWWAAVYGVAQSWTQLKQLSLA